MIDSFSHLWNLMTIFFTQEVVTQPLFMAMLLLPTIFCTVYYLMRFLDPDTWGYKF